MRAQVVETFMNDPPDEPKTTKRDEPVEFELRQKIVKDDGKKLH